MQLKSHIYACTAAALLVSATPTVHGQDADAQRRLDRGDLRRHQATELAAGLLVIQVDQPAEVRVGDTANYRVTVTNATEQIALYDVVLKPKPGQGLTIEKAQAEQASQQPNQKHSDQKQSDEKKSDQKQSDEKQSDQKQSDEKQSDQKQSADQKQSDQQSKQNQSAQQQSSADQISADSMTLAKLNPGESRVINLTVSSSKAGQGEFCILLDSYRSAVCVPTMFVQPELEITKTGPDKAHVCEVIEVEYTIKNGGTGDVDKVTIIDDLPDGLMTIEGDKQIKYTPEGSLAAGEVRRFVARLTASKAGEFKSRAKVTGGEDLSAQSGVVAIAVVAPELSTTISGPSVESASNLLSYQITVTNRGDAPARNAELTFHYPRQLTLERVGDWRAVQAPSRQQGASGEPTKSDGAADAIAAANQASKSPQADGGQESENMEQNTWGIGDIPAGASRQLNVVMHARESGQLNFRAVTESLCGEDEQFRVVSEARFTTEILSLTGLRIMIVDNHDPVASSEEVAYTIIVDNQGESEAKNVSVTAKLPEQLKFVSAEGDSNAKNDGGNITFETVASLKAKARLKWVVTAKPASDQLSGATDTVVQAELSSDTLDKPVTSEEPTTLFTRQRKTVKSGAQDNPEQENPEQENPEQENPDQENPEGNGSQSDQE